MLDDQLDRAAFARAAAGALKKVSADGGLVLSVEGAWGSGKTSTLAMIQETLEVDDTAPVIVRFNPWLVGDRDSLLRQFLAKLAEAVKLADHAKGAKKAAKELKSYAKVFDVLRLIPGAEPWASMIKSVVESVSDATDSIAEYKTPDIELQKERVEAALKRFSKRIIVFIDDVDRLFPLEVFEMIRIVKAVGELPNVGYVLAWDPDYVVQALNEAHVPQANAYLDKIVQIRMPLPTLSTAAKVRLINRALGSLESGATAEYFPRSTDRLSTLYYSGLRDVLEQPRDFIRVFNTVSAMEPALRGEVVFADMVGLAALMVKAPAVFDLLRKQPRWYVGRLPGETNLVKDDSAWLKEGAQHRQSAGDSSVRPSAVDALVARLFPATATGSFMPTRVVDVEGHIASPPRLLIALQMSVTGSDVSIVNARKYLTKPDHRASIVQTLTRDNCVEFLESLGEVGKSFEQPTVPELDLLCVAIARLVDTPCFVERSTDRSGFWAPSPEGVAVHAIAALVIATDPTRIQEIAARIVEDDRSLSVANLILLTSYDNEAAPEPLSLIGARTDKKRLLRVFARNAVAAAQRGDLASICTLGSVLWNLAHAAPSECPKVFAAIREENEWLDKFATALFQKGFDSNKGLRFKMLDNTTTLEAYASMAALRALAEKRLADAAVVYPTRAVWRAVVEEGAIIYGVDGSLAKR